MEVSENEVKLSLEGKCLSLHPLISHASGSGSLVIQFKESVVQPHRYLPDECYHLTRRCRDGSFWINPSPKVNQALLYILFRCVNRYRMELHLFTYMPNHYHLIITDPHGELGNFLTALNSLSTKCLNDLFRREGYLWEPGACDKPYLAEPVDFRDAMAYVILNPVRAGLVERPQDWPGLNSGLEDLDGRLLTATIPSWYFNPAKNPEQESVRLSIPKKLLEDSSAGEVLEELRELVEEEKRLIHQGMRARNKKFLGARNILRRPREDRPRNASIKNRFRLSFICQNPERRKIEIEELRQFWKEYREAFEAFRKGDRDVVFPPGTFKMRRDAGVNCYLE